MVTALFIKPSFDSKTDLSAKKELQLAYEFKMPIQQYNILFKTFINYKSLISITLNKKQRRSYIFLYLRSVYQYLCWNIFVSGYHKWVYRFQGTFICISIRVVLIENIVWSSDAGVVGGGMRGGARDASCRAETWQVPHTPKPSEMR